MNLLIRLFWVLFRAFLGRRIDAFDESVIRLRVLPTDLDLNWHMNNGRYLTLMDLGRLDLTVRCGLGKIVLRRRWAPTVASAAIRFKRGLKPFESYTLHTRIAAWDEKFVYLEQRFEAAGRVAAIAMVKALFRAPGRNVPTSELLAALGRDVESPPLPEGIRAWNEADAEMFSIAPAKSGARSGA